MNDRVFKYALEITQRQMIQMPRGARVLSVAIVNEQPVLFALVDDRKPAEPRIVRTARTGEVFNATGCTFVGTLCFEAVGHVFHVFEQTEGVSDPREPRFQPDFDDVANLVPFNREEIAIAHERKLSEAVPYA